MQKGQVVAELLPHPRAVVESRTTIGEILGIQEREEEKFANSTQPLKARQDVNRRIKVARTSQGNGRQGSPRRHLRSRNAGLSRHRRTWRNST